uniref:Importin N-terminal domain-containing protein n=1 Tax=Hemiselmis andersenii TaxID=464988 RepID=A0A6U4NCF6_HEMAN
MAWQPDQTRLNQVGELLQACSDPSQHDRHVQALQMLDAGKREMPDFGCYMLLVFCKMPEAPMQLRQLAGLELKNTIRLQHHKMDPNVLTFVRQSIIDVLGAEERRSRMIAAQIITTLLSIVTLDAWPELIPGIIAKLDAQGTGGSQGAMAAMILVCEDHNNALCSQQHADTLAAILAKLMAQMQSSDAEFRAGAIRCVKHFILRLPNALVVNLPAFLNGLLALHKDASPEVRKEMCQSLCLLVEVKADFLADPQICQFVIEFLLWTTEHDSDYDVKKEACEFWSSLCENEEVASDVLKPYLSRLTLVLLNGMVYSEDELINLADEVDASAPDKASEINPSAFHVKSKHHVADDEEEDEDDEEGGGVEWTLRKCSAAGLDVIANHYRDDILEALLPHIHTKLTDPDWRVIESAVLAMGALAVGCEEGLIQRNYLPSFVTHLLQHMLSSEMPLVRSITSWTLSRYSRWIAHQTNPADGQHSLLPPLVEGFLKGMLDSSKKVQEAACSAMATLEEEAGSLLVPHVAQILQVFSAALPRYQARNLVILYDACGTLADSLGPELGKKEHVDVLLPPLMQKWQSLADDDRSLFPLLECLASVVQALGQGFTPSAPPVFQRCERLIAMGLHRQQAGELDAHDNDFIVCPLDLISSLAEGMGSSIESLVGQSQLVPSLMICCQHPDPAVRQSAFALVGDLAKTSLPHLRPHLGQIMALTQGNITPEHVSVCNNATWAVGELAVRIGGEMDCVIPGLLPPLIQLINRTALNKSLLENSAIAVGRFGLVCPQLVSQHLTSFVQPWCKILSFIRDDVEKEHAFRGLVKMAMINPQGLLDSFDCVCMSLNSWNVQVMPPDLHKELCDMLAWFKVNLEQANQWAGIYGRVPIEVQGALQQHYNLTA